MNKSSFSELSVRKKKNGCTHAHFKLWVFTFGKVFAELHDSSHVTVYGSICMWDCSLGLGQSLSNHSANIRGRDLSETSLKMTSGMNWMNT